MRPQGSLDESKLRHLESSASVPQADSTACLRGKRPRGWTNRSNMFFVRLATTSLARRYRNDYEIRPLSVLVSVSLAASTALAG
jgi:hypothetical protein